MKPVPKDRDWFTTFCTQCAANVLDRNNDVRFSYTTLSTALLAVENNDDFQVPRDVVELFRNIVGYCNKVKGQQEFTDNEEHALLLTLLNIQAAFTMVCGAWKEIPADDKDEYGFEIF